MKTISELAGEEFDCRKRFEAMGMMNSNFGTYEDRKKLAIDYAEARARWMAARSMLEAAMRQEQYCRE